MAVSILIPAFNPDLNLPAYVRELCEAGFSHIVVIDDGSFQEKQEIFQRLETEYGCLVLRHAVNMGKGRALKDALNYYQVFLSRECSGVITADCDGQHTVEDIRRMGQAMEEHPDSLILGARDFDQKSVPAKSRVGNKLTRTVMRLFYGGKISDTQTGLRAIPNSLVEEYLTLPGERFEFETAMLLTALRRKTRIEEVPIQTVYLDGNKSTHFRPVADSWAIYKLILGTFFKYSLSSLSSCLIDFALFLNFFATVTQGPICRAGALLPQLKAEHRFDAARTVQALRLLALGLFKLVAVSDVLGLLVDEVFPHYGSYGGPMLVLAAVFYTFQLYFNFSGYSEVARAVGLLLGLTLPENFKTPFFATNFSGFWSRWHISFSSWLQDYLFMPLAWADLGRFGRLPTELCVFCVFFASGFWHGSTAPFIIWGLLQAVYRVGEELLHRRFGKPKKRGTPARVLWGKRVVVFVLWTISMVFFRVGSGNLSGVAESLGVGDAFVYLGRCLMNSWSPARFAGELYSTAYTGFYANTIMVAAYWAFAALALALGIWLDHRRNFACKNKPAEVALASAKHRNALYVVLIVFILVGYIMQSGGFNANAFGPYAGF